MHWSDVKLCLLARHNGHLAQRLSTFVSIPLEAGTLVLAASRMEKLVGTSISRQGGGNCLQAAHHAGSRIHGARNGIGADAARAAVEGDGNDFEIVNVVEIAADGGF